jgi:hypothetical protein
MMRIGYSQLIKEQVALSLRLLKDIGQALCKHCRAVVAAANAKIFAELNPEVSFQKHIAFTVGVAPSAVSPFDPDVQVRDNTELVIVRTAVARENMPGAPSEQSATLLQSPGGQGGSAKADHNVHALFQSVSRSEKQNTSP